MNAFLRFIKIFCLVSFITACEANFSQYFPDNSGTSVDSSAPKSSGTFHPIFQDVVLEIATKTNVPTMLPGYVPEYPGGPRLNAILTELNESKYEILLAYTPDCTGENVCRLGRITAETIDDSVSLEGEQAVTLNDGSTAYFTDAECNTYCTDSTLAWQKKSVVYTIGIKAGKMPILVKMANSM